jgi:hypothetical protein
LQSSQPTDTGAARREKLQAGVESTAHELGIEINHHYKTLRTSISTELEEGRFKKTVAWW